MNLYKVVFKNGIEEYYEINNSQDMIQIYIDGIKSGKDIICRKFNNKYMFVININDISSIILIENTDANQK